MKPFYRQLNSAESCLFFSPDRAFALAKKLISEDRVRQPRNPNDYAPLMAQLFGITMIDRVGRWLVTGTDSEFDAKWLARVELCSSFEELCTNKKTYSEWVQLIIECQKKIYDDRFYALYVDRLLCKKKNYDDRFYALYVDRLLGK